jgi:hypothetical protein
MDYFCLRQCANDFSPPTVIDLISEFGHVILRRHALGQNLGKIDIKKI